MVVSAAVAGLVLAAATGAGARQSAPDISVFLQAASADEAAAANALTQLRSAWRDGYAPIVVDLLRFLVPPPIAPASDAATVDLTNITALGDPPERRAGVLDLSASPDARPISPAALRLRRFLEERTGQRFGDDLDRWREWMWARPYDPHPAYLAFKGALYAQIDPRMRRFFTHGATIRLDEIDWGGVRVNGIPPLVNPAVIAAGAATWLKDSHMVFGISLNG
jgi:hypothetical protein